MRRPTRLQFRLAGKPIGPRLTIDEQQNIEYHITQFNMLANAILHSTTAYTSREDTLYAIILWALNVGRTQSIAFRRIVLDCGQAMDVLSPESACSLALQVGDLAWIQCLHTTYHVSMNWRDGFWLRVLIQANPRRILDILKYLVYHGANLGYRDCVGQTLWDFAQRSGNAAVLQYLALSGIGPSYTGFIGRNTIVFPMTAMAA